MAGGKVEKVIVVSMSVWKPAQARLRQARDKGRRPASSTTTGSPWGSLPRPAPNGYGVATDVTVPKRTVVSAVELIYGLLPPAA